MRDVVVVPLIKYSQHEHHRAAFRRRRDRDAPRLPKSKWVTQGPVTERFEKLVADRHAVKHALACTSCTSALHLATMALGLGPGDEMIVPAFTWVTSAHAAEYVGARAVFVDIDLATYNIDASRHRGGYYATHTRDHGGAPVWPCRAD